MTAPHGARRPEKPAGSPLTPGSNGQWVKKYRGQVYCCGPWADHDAAVRRWWEILKEVEERALRDSRHLVTVDTVTSRYIGTQALRVDSGDLSQRTLNDYITWANWLNAELGPETRVVDLTTGDFDGLRAGMPGTWGTHRIRHCVTTVRQIFTWAHKVDLIAPVNLGTMFVLPSRKRSKADKRARHAKIWTKGEIRRLAACADAQMGAMILLGLNAAYTNIDCSRLLQAQVTTPWLDEPRVKTGEERKAWLWPSTRQAIREAIDAHPPDDGVFLHSSGRPWSDPDSCRCRITTHFRELKRRSLIHKPGVGFAALRHTFRTVADETQDFPAVRYVMGHRDETGSNMDAIYREGISDDRVRAVCEYVQDWYNS